MLFRMHCSLCRWPFEFDPNAQSSEEYLETALKTAQERLLFIDSDELVLKFVSMCPMPEKKSEFTANYRKSIKRVNEVNEASSIAASSARAGTCPLLPSPPLALALTGKCALSAAG